MSSTSRIGIAGAGPVAYALGRLLCRRGQPLVAVASRNRSHADQLAAALGPTVRAVEYAELPSEAARLIVAVSDTAIRWVADTLAAHGMRGIVLHTCGAYGADALAPLEAQGVACGVLHPLQAFPSAGAGAEPLNGITFGVGGDPPAVEWANEITSLADGHALLLEEAQRPRYHAAAVLASNALVASVDAALVLLEQAGIDRTVALRSIAPLSRTTLENTLRYGPLASMTGPVSRGDVSTVQRHLHALADAPGSTERLYRAASEQLLDIARRRGLDDARAQALESTLRAQG